MGRRSSREGLDPDQIQISLAHTNRAFSGSIDQSQPNPYGTGPIRVNRPFSSGQTRPPTSIHTKELQRGLQRKSQRRGSRESQQRPSIEKSRPANPSFGQPRHAQTSGRSGSKYVQRSREEDIYVRGERPPMKLENLFGLLDLRKIRRILGKNMTFIKFRCPRNALNHH